MKKRYIESEEKLSMTRELKFRELQEKIDDEESDRIIEEAIKKSKKKVYKVEETTELEKEIDALLASETKKSRKKTKVKDEKSENEINDLLNDTIVKKEKKRTSTEKQMKINYEDDLYLTSSFKPLKHRFKISKLIKFIFKSLFVLSLLGAFIYFVLLPLFNMIENSKPKAIFDNTLGYIQKQINNFIDNNIETNKNAKSIEMTYDFDTNISEFKSLSNYKYTFNMGIDLEQKTFEKGYYIEVENDVKYGITYYENENNFYSKYTTNTHYLNKGESKNNGLIKNFNQTAIDKNEYKYFINKMVSTLKEVIDENDLYASKVELEIDGFTVNVIRNSLELDIKKVIDYEKQIKDKYINDERFIKTYAYLKNTTPDEIKEKLNEENEYSESYVLTFNIYTTKGNKFVGFDIEENGFRDFYYYKYDNKFEAHFNLSNIKDCLNNDECTETTRQIIDLIGTTKNNITKIHIIHNDEDIGNINLKDFSFNKVFFDYNISLKNSNYVGNLLMSYDKTNKNYKINFDLNKNNKYFKLNSEFKLNEMNKIGYIDDTKVLKYTDTLHEKEKNKYYQSINNDSIQKSFNDYIKIIEYFNSWIKIE